MTIKTSISFTDRHHKFAHDRAKQGVFTSVSSVVAAGIELIMQDEIEREAALLAMSETIKRRMATPRDQWIEWKDDPLFAKARARLHKTESE